MDNQLRERLLLLSSDKDVFNKAKQLQLIRKDNQLKIKDIADVFQVKSSYICQLIRLNRLPEMIRDGYYGKQINISLLFIISRLRSEQDIVNAYEKILQSGLSVFQAENLVREMLFNIKSEGSQVTKVEIDQLVSYIKNVIPDATVKFRQTQIKMMLRIDLKGNLESTSSTVKKILSQIK